MSIFLDFKMTSLEALNFTKSYLLPNSNLFFGDDYFLLLFQGQRVEKAYG